MLAYIALNRPLQYSKRSLLQVMRHWILLYFSAILCFALFLFFFIISIRCSAYWPLVCVLVHWSAWQWYPSIAMCLSAVTLFILVSSVGWVWCWWWCVVGCMVLLSLSPLCWAGEEWVTCRKFPCVAMIIWQVSVISSSWVCKIIVFLCNRYYL